MNEASPQAPAQAPALSSDRVEPTIERGRELLEAQREALVAGDLERLAGINQALSDWLAASAQAIASNASIASNALESGALAALRSTLRVNAELAAMAASSNARALEALFAVSPAPTYGSDGRASVPAPNRGRFSA